MIKKLIVCVYLLLPTICNSQVITHNISDDGYAHVPLQFPFPLYGRVFTDSFMYSNGVVGFGSVNNHWCCNGYDLTNARGYQFNYSIIGLQTDLINYGQGRFQTEGTTQYQRYRWENISEYGAPQNLNTFGIEIRPNGSISMLYEQVNLSPWRLVTRGITGDTIAGEYQQFYHGPGYTSQTVSYITQNPVDPCVQDPLSSPSCSGYAVAYYNQQCSLSALYDTGCPGYTEAYYNQQCSLNALYDRGCPGYAEAYALANIVATPTTTVSAPTLQVSTTGTVSVETPVVSDPVVNEVITRPPVINNVQTTSSVSTPSQSVSQSEKKEDSKTEKKTESKQVATTKNTSNQNEIPTQSIPTPTYEYKAPIILDLAYQKMVKKPIKDNNRAMYHLIMNSQIKHEEMVNEQYRR